MPTHWRLFRHTDDDVFDDFPKTSDHFPKISEDFPKLFRRPDERSRTFSENFLKIFDDFRRLPNTNEFKYKLRDKLNISEIIDIFTSEDMENTLKSRM